MPSQIDLIAGFDPTGGSSVSPSNLLTMVAGATPYTDKGLIVVTTDIASVPQVPDAGTTTKWQTYLWARIQPQTTSVTLYVWNPNSASDVTLLNWVPVVSGTIAPGQIQGYMIAPSTITYDKILNIQLSQVVGYTTLLTTSISPAAGDISGSYALGFTINNGAVTLAKFDTTGAVTKILTANGAGNPATWDTPPNIYTGLANPNGAGSDDGKMVVVNSGAAGTFKYVAIPSPTTLGRILQVVSSGTITTQKDCTGLISMTDTAASLTTARSSGVAVTITPLSGTSGSKIIVEANMATYSSGNNNALWLGIYDSVAAAFVTWARWYPSSSTSVSGAATLRFITAALAVNTARTYTVYIGTVSGTAANGAINQYLEGSIITATEYI